MTRERYLTKFVIEDLKKKMVFVGGPRQVGKTTLALELIAKRFGRSGYFNWDSRIEVWHFQISNSIFFAYKQIFYKLFLLLCKKVRHQETETVSSRSNQRRGCA